jgi:hypothetical protein
MQKYGNQQIVAIDARRWNESQSAEFEARMIGDTARKIHLDGYRWIEWPTVKRWNMAISPNFKEDRDDHLPPGWLDADARELRATHILFRLTAICEER